MCVHGVFDVCLWCVCVCVYVFMVCLMCVYDVCVFMVCLMCVYGVFDVCL